MSSISTPSTITTPNRMDEGPKLAGYGRQMARACLRNVFHLSDGIWFFERSTSGFRAMQFGQIGDRPVPAAYVAARQEKRSGGGAICFAPFLYTAGRTPRLKNHRIGSFVAILYLRNSGETISPY